MQLKPSSEMDEIKNLTKKHPSWRKVFESYYNLNKNNSFEQIKETFDKLIKYKNLIHKDITPIIALSLKSENNKPEIEVLGDLIHKTIHNKQMFAFIEELKKSNYGHLMSPFNQRRIMNIVTNITTIKDFKKNGLRKIARYKTDEEFSCFLLDYIENNGEWSKKYYKNKIKKIKDIKIVKETKKTLLIEVFSFESSKKLGSQNWCISYNEGDFNHYKKNMGRQYFYYDFRKNSIDNLSMIGITVDTQGEIIDAYLKDDTNAQPEDLPKIKYNKIKNKVIKKYIENITNPEIRLVNLAQLNATKLFIQELEKYKEIKLNSSRFLSEAITRSNFKIIDKIFNSENIEIEKGNYNNILSIIIANDEIDLLKKVISYRKYHQYIEENDIHHHVGFINNSESTIKVLKILKKVNKINNIIKENLKLFHPNNNELTEYESDIIFLVYTNLTRNKTNFVFLMDDLMQLKSPVLEKIHHTIIEEYKAYKKSMIE